MGYWGVVLNVIKNSDVLLIVVDSRIPEMSKNKEVLRRGELMNKRVHFVFNKIDLISKIDLEELKKKHPTSYFVSCKDKPSIKELKDFLVNLAENFENESLRIGLVGYPNVGKSSIINLLSNKAKAKVKNYSGTTKAVSWIREGRLRIMDSPGVIPVGEGKVNLGITGSIDSHKVKNVEKVAFGILNYVVKRKKGVLGKVYGIEEVEKVDENFELIGRKKGWVKKGGNVDENRTSVGIVKDWQSGKINFS